MMLFPNYFLYPVPMQIFLSMASLDSHRAEDNIPHPLLFVCPSHRIPTVCTLTYLSPVPFGVCNPSSYFQIINILTIYLPGSYSTFLLQPVAALVVGISASQRKPNKKAGVLPLPRATSAETIWRALLSHRT